MNKILTGGTLLGRNVTAILGPTNTGKTHFAIERMLAHRTGIIGLPLRLLAREVYGRICRAKGAGSVALITGEEKIIPENPCYWVATVEAMPHHISCEFVAIDEVQLIGDLERGHVFTDRIMNIRGSGETLLLGASTARAVIEKIIPDINIVTRPRLSVLRYAGAKKMTRLPPRSAIIAFSAAEVYAIAELIRRQHGGAAVVLGSLSPRTRNAQVELFQSGDVVHMVATDAIGMGLNLALDHVAFAGRGKFDGHKLRELTPAEMGQIAGRAGRHINDGSFGVTGRAAPLDDRLVDAIENHRFDALQLAQWRSRDLNFDSLGQLMESLEQVPQQEGLTRALPASDLRALMKLAKTENVSSLATNREIIGKLWEICQIPDYRKLAPANHIGLIETLFEFIADKGVIDEDWFAAEIGLADHLDGDIETLTGRIAQIRSGTYIANQSDWLADPEHWRAVTRNIEERLSDALHEKLTARFVDRRTSVLMRRLREKGSVDVEIDSQGAIKIEGLPAGEIHGLQLMEPAASDIPASSTGQQPLPAEARRAITQEIGKRAKQLSRQADEGFCLDDALNIMWRGHAVARLGPGAHFLSPQAIILADDQLEASARVSVSNRLKLWLESHLQAQLKALFSMQASDNLNGVARGIAYRMIENLAILPRREIADDLRRLDQEMRAHLRRSGVRFGAHHIFVPYLLKTAPRKLIAQLWSIAQPNFDKSALQTVFTLIADGRTSMPRDHQISETIYRLAGYGLVGERAVRIDILERLSDMIRTQLSAPVEDQHAQRLTQAKAADDSISAEKTNMAESLAPPAGKPGEGRPDQQIADRPSPLEITTAEGNAAASAAVSAAPEQGQSDAPKEKDNRKGNSNPEKPKKRGFIINAQMLAIIGCSRIDMALLLEAMGFVRAKSAPSEDDASFKPVALSPLSPALSPQERESQAALPGGASEQTSHGAGDGAHEAVRKKSTTPGDEIWFPAPRRMAARTDRKRGEIRRKPVADRQDAQSDSRKFSHGEKKRAGRGSAQDLDRYRARGKRGAKAVKAGENTQHKPNQPQQKFRANRAVDPNSPFAALAALKGKLNK